MEKQNKPTLRQEEKSGRIIVIGDGSWDYTPEGMKFLGSQKKSRHLHNLVRAIISLVTNRHGRIK